MSKLIVEHFSNGSNRLVVTGVRVPAKQAFHETGIHHGGIVLPINTLQRIAVEHRVDEVDFSAGLVPCVSGHFVLYEIPPEFQDRIVAAIVLRFGPREQLSLRI